MTDERPHPAKFNKPLLVAIDCILTAEGILPPATILDPMAGVGTGVAHWNDLGYHAQGVELEPEWAMADPMVRIGDARKLSEYFGTSHFDAIITSPAYGNRMADKYAGDPKGSARHTYRISLGRKLSEGSGAAEQYGDAYCNLHAQIVKQMSFFAKDLVIVNMKNHIRNGEEVDVCLFWEKLIRISFPHWRMYAIEVPTAGQRHGANGDLRVDHEILIVAARNRIWPDYTHSNKVRYVYEYMMRPIRE